MFQNSYRAPATRMLTDETVKRILGHADLSFVDGGLYVHGRIIGWKRTASGALGAVVLYPVTGARHLWCVNFADGRPRRLAPLH